MLAEEVATFAARKVWQVLMGKGTAAAAHPAANSNNANCNAAAFSAAAAVPTSPLLLVDEPEGFTPELLLRLGAPSLQVPGWLS